MLRSVFRYRHRFRRILAMALGTAGHALIYNDGAAAGSWSASPCRRSAWFLHPAGDPAASAEAKRHARQLSALRAARFPRDGTLVPIARLIGTVIEALPGSGQGAGRSPTPGDAPAIAGARFRSRWPRTFRRQGICADSSRRSPPHERGVAYGC
jgi:hypothetical protein